MSGAETPVNEQVAAALDAVVRKRERLMVLPDSQWRCAQLAELAEIEACWWQVLFEHARIRVYWRAALAAHEAARQSARMWRRRADAHPGRGVPRLPALTRRVAA
jgi:hypothetical protein